MYFRLLFCLLVTLTANSLWAADAARVVFAAGEVKVADRPAQLGQLVTEGQSLATGPDGYLYLQTLDKGFFILRPNSVGQIVTYQIDPINPANSRIKLELQNGVARHISGEAVKSSRQNFRFNTPVAAVGVRGTDFTVFASQDITRITVFSGGVTVSPLSSACVVSGFGPCDGPASRELFATKTSLMLQVNRGQMPVLLPTTEQAPDGIAPPRADEPVGTKTSARTAPAGSVDIATTSEKLNALKSSLVNQFANQTPNQQMPVDQAVTQPGVGRPVAPTAQPLIWGRWQALLDRTIEVDVAALQGANQLVATNAYYAILRSREIPWQPPAQASIGFSLKQSEAVILDEASGRLTPAKLENGQLKIDFARSSFFTRFDLVNQKERFVLQNQGEVSPEGKLYGGAQFLSPNNMSVRGALANDNLNAALLFQSRLDDRRLATGASYWGK